MKKSNRLFVWLVALVLVGGMLASVPVNRAQAASPPPLMTLDPSSLPATLVSQTTIAGEDVVTTWTDPSGDTTTVAGPAGSVLDFSVDSLPSDLGAVGGYDVAVTPPLISTTAITGDQAIAQYAASGLSLSQDALAVGFSDTEAQQLVNENSSAPIISHVCINHTWSGVHAVVHACTIQHLIQHSGAKDWYIANKTVASWSALGHSALEKTQTWVSYSLNQSRIDWSPTDTITKGSCQTVTFSVTDPSSGLGFSFPKTICPETLSPYIGRGYFGAIWKNTNGVCPGIWRNDPSLALESDPQGSPGDTYTLWAKPWVYLNHC